MPKNQQTSRRQETTLEERVKVIRLNAEGFSQRTIAAQVGVSKTTVHNIIRDYHIEKKLHHLPRPGMPPTRNKRGIRQLVRISDTNPYATLAEIATCENLPVYNETIAQQLWE